MRVTTVGAIILSALPFITFAAEGDYCVIPKLEKGKPTIVDVPYIDKPFCGMAMIDRHYVRLSEFTKAHRYFLHQDVPILPGREARNRTLHHHLPRAKKAEIRISSFFRITHVVSVRSL